LELQLSNDITPESILKDIDVSKFDKVVFVPFQLPNDVVITNFAGFAKNQDNFVKLIQRLAAENPKILFLYKNHPIEKVLNTQTDNLINVDKYHFKACLNICDSVFLINSGVGLQAMFYGKPVFAFGDTFYSFEGINHNITNTDQILPLLNSDFEVDMVKVQRFIYWLHFKFYSSVVWESIPNCNNSKLHKVNTFRLFPEYK